MEKKALSKRVGWISALFLIGGVLLLAGLAVHLSIPGQTRKLNACTAITQGVITNSWHNFDVDEDGRDHSTYSYTITYTVDGSDYKLIREQRKKPEEGASLTVHYNPDSPSDAYVGALLDISLQARLRNIFLPAGGTLVLAGFVLIYSIKKNARKGQ